MCVNRLTRTLLFVVDTAGDMRGELISEANGAISNVISELRRILSERNDVMLEVVSLPFSVDSVLTLPHPEDIRNYSWINLTSSRMYGARLSLVFEKLKETYFFSNNLANYLSPTVILILNSTLDSNYENELEKLRTQTKFGSAFKAAILLGDGVDVEKIIEFTEDYNNVAVVRSGNDLAQKIREMTLYGVFHDLLSEEDINNLLRNVRTI
jgi:uncharacterized protein YegL